MAKSFTHLHLHTEYSLLDGMSKIKALISRVKELGMDSLAITDHGVMYGIVEFYKNATSEGIKPIVGMEAYTTNVELGSKSEKRRMKNYHLLLLAKNNVGYKNLMKLTSIAHLEGYYYKPRITKDILKKYSEGLICTSACPAGELASNIIEDDYDKAKKTVEWFLDVFGEDYYLELQRHRYETHINNQTPADIKRELSEMQSVENKLNENLVKLSRDMGVPLVATNDAHYIKKEDASAQDALVCIATGKTVSDTKRLRFIDTPEFYVKTAEEMYELFPDYPDACENTLKVAEKCEIEIKLGQWFFPKIDIPKGVSASEVLKQKVEAGLKEKYDKVTKELQDRVNYELKVISDKQYPEYFLIYEDMAKWAKDNRVPINTRGSAAGSLVSYCLGITSVDPIRYLLPFERFLNPYRPSAPDIDMDISDTKREAMISYLVDKYGEDKVAQICTFGRMLARGSVRDVARVLGYPYDMGDKISKLIPIGSQGFPMTIDRALDESPELKNLYEGDRDAKKIIDLAKQIEGNARHISVHAAGLVISPTSITDFTPVQKEPAGEKIITQFEMHACEDIGLVKLDILGIRNLQILEEAVNLVEKTRGTKIDLGKIDLEDKSTFEMLSKGQTFGVFQLGGSGMTKYLVELQPERIEDIMAMIALFRPGPMGNIPEYISRKRGKSEITYYHPKMEKFLDKSFGILVYQDDLLYTALELAGYDWEEVDKFRKAVGKKIPEEMRKQHIKFVEGCVKHSGMSKEEAEGLWKLFEPFQGYGFNKAHAASYGMVSYQTAYMKANYPTEYMCALMTAESNDIDKISLAVSECRSMGIKVLPPDINESGIAFTVVSNDESLDGKAIRFGLSAIKNVGDAAVESILTSRNEAKFTSFVDFLTRVDSRRVNKRVLESLIKAGAMSNFGSRASLIKSIDEIRSRVVRPKGQENQQGLFSNDEMKDASAAANYDSLLFAEEFNDSELEDFERQLIGFSLSAKPVDELIEPLAPHATHKINDLGHDTKEEITIAAVVSEIRVIITKKTGKEMAFVKVSDGTGTIDLVVFPKIYEVVRDKITDNAAILATGRLDSREDSTSILVDQIKTNENLELLSNETLYIRVPANAAPENLKKLRNVLIKAPGNQKVTLIFEGQKSRKLDLNLGIAWSSSLAQRISQCFEESN